LIGDLVSDAFHLAKVAAFSREDLLRFLKNLQATCATAPAQRRQHVERDAGFGRVHLKSDNG
jgi:hypothetical protein